MLSEKLEIIIPTFNRAETLAQTLNIISSSPVSDCEISVLDNNSNDNTFDVVKSFTDLRINYVKNNYNIGLAGNLVKAMTLPKKKYFWVIFDDTGLDFSNWDCVQQGIIENYDCVLTTNYYNVKDVSERGPIFLMLIYMFAGIYKTELLSDELISYAATDIYTVHPQIALISELFNSNKSIYLPQKAVTYPKINPETDAGKEYSFNRLSDKFNHFRLSKPANFVHGFFNAIQSVKDNELKEECIRLLFKTYNGLGPYYSIFDFVRLNYDLANRLDILIRLPKDLRLNFLFNLLRYKIFKRGV